MSDIVERLRNEAETELEWTATYKIMTETADEIERLRAALTSARNAALEEAAKVADQAHDEWEGDSKLWHKEGMLQTAAAALLHAEAAAKVATAIRELKETGE